MHRFPARLLDGYREFLANRYASERQRYRRLAEHGQRPPVMVIACCDSRAAPETIFDAGPGELFVVRNVANLVPAFQPDGGQHGTSAAIEFAVLTLGVADIVVLGHGRCGGIGAALDRPRTPAPEGDFIGKWMAMIAPALAELGDAPAAPAARQTALERLSIRHSLANLRGFPYVRERQSAGTLTLHGAWFDIAGGELWLLDPATGDFRKPD